MRVQQVHELALSMTVEAAFLKLTSRNQLVFTTMSSDSKPERVKVTTGAQCRRRWTPSEKLALVHETYQAGKTVSFVAREADITASQLFQWCKAYTDGSLIAVGVTNQWYQLPK